MGNTCEHCWKGLSDCAQYCCEGCEQCYVCMRPCCTSMRDEFRSCCAICSCQGFGQCLQCNTNPCLILDKSTPDIQQTLQNYEHKTHYLDEWYGDVILLENKQTKLLAILKVQEFLYQTDFEEQNQQFLQRKLLQNDNIVQLNEYMSRQEEGFCTSIYKSFLIFDYILTDFASEFQYRLENKIPYQQDEFYPIIYQCINGLNYLHQNGIMHQALRMRNIFITQDKYKIADPHLFDHKNDYQKIYSDKQKYSKIAYLSPELVSELDKGNKEPNVDWFKSDIYSLGMVFLQLCSGKQSSLCYDYDQGVIFEDKISSHLQTIKISCHDFFFYIIKDMLTVKVSQRPTAQQLFERLDKNPKCKQSISPVQIILEQHQDQQMEQQYQQQDVSQLIGGGGQDLIGEPNTFDQYDVLGLIGNEPTKQKDLVENVKERYPNGSRYQGMKRNGLRHGKGKFIHTDGSYYDGMWKDNKMSGKGVLYNSQGKVIYDGSWTDDQYHGQGIEYNQDQIPMISGLDHNNLTNITCWLKYEGAFKRDNREGFGTLSFSNGDKYIGAFKDGQIHGFGTYSYKNGQSIQGKWNMGKLQK
ncbi:unnamed protein product [Paramecium octaurelia]|uniref:Protein kinase domain-containing protein n=1 Tax=Paramecium octaurelia TaxID=43137 RepID=A0A8S1T5A1_PAROT|nr:unnamed protein product [Paramecium octaurelia]